MRSRLVILGLLLSNAAWAGTNIWTSLGPDGGAARSLVIDPLNPNTVYALTSAGLFKSTDGNASWNVTSPFSANPADVYVTSLVIDPRNPSTLYAATPQLDPGQNWNWVFKSTDGGASWRALRSARIGALSPSGIRFEISGPLAIDPEDTNTIYAGGNEDIFKSTDGGETWKTSNSGLPTRNWLSVRSLVIEPQHPSTVYAVTRVGVFKSINRGASWSPLYPFGRREYPEFDALTIDPQNPNTQYAWRGWGGAFKSTDGGASWSAANSGLPIHGNDPYPFSSVTALAIHPQNSGTLYAATPWGLYRSTDGASNWTKLDSQPGGGVHVLALDPQNPSTIYANAGDSIQAGVYKSTDGAASWSGISSGLRAIGISRLTIAPQQPAMLYANGAGALLKSIDKGMSWNRVSSMDLLAIDPQDPSTLFGTDSGGNLAKSTDGGANWSPASVGLPIYCDDSVISSIAIDPQTTRTVYVGLKTQFCDSGEKIAGGVWKSTDGAASWTKVQSLPEGDGGYGLAINPQSPSTVYASNGMGLFKSTDGGTSWTLLHRIGRSLTLTIDPQSPSTLYAVLNDTTTGDPLGVYKTTDGGESWVAVNSGLPTFSREVSIHALAIDPRNTGTLYASIRWNGVYKSTDGGANWSAVNSGLTTLDVSTLAIDPHDTSTVYAGTAAGVFAITFTFPAQ